MPAEGWYSDPSGAHEARWYSEGRPTALVRDGTTESHDPPPAGATGPEWSDPCDLPEEGRRDDLRRSDAAEAGPAVSWTTPEEAVWDVEAE
jgi:hypothetical protein